MGIKDESCKYVRCCGNGFCADIDTMCPDYKLSGPKGMEANGLPKSPFDTLPETNLDVLARLTEEAGHEKLECGCVKDKHGVFFIKCGGH